MMITFGEILMLTAGERHDYQLRHGR